MIETVKQVFVCFHNCSKVQKLVSKSDLNYGNSIYTMTDEFD